MAFKAEGHVFDAILEKIDQLEEADQLTPK